MKQLVFIQLFLFTFNISAQIPDNPNLLDDSGNKQGTWTILFDELFNPTDEISNAFYYRIVTYKDSHPVGIIRDYYLNGNIQWEGYMISEEPDPVYDGLCIWYHENGNKSQEAFFEKGELINTKYYNLDGSEVLESYELLTSQGWDAVNNTDYNSAINTFLKALDQAKSQYGTNNLIYGNALTALGMSFNLAGIHHKAIQYLHRAIDTYKATIGMGNPYYPWAIKGLADTYQDSGQYEQALEYYTEYVRINEIVYGTDNPQFASAMNDLAGQYEIMGKDTLAEKFYNQSLEIYEGLSALEEGYILLLGNMAYFLETSKQDFDNAEKLYQKQLAAINELYGKRNTSYVLALRTLAGICQKQYKFRESIQLLDTAITIIQNIHGKENRIYMNLLDDQAENYLGMDNFSVAENYYLEAIAIAKILFEETDLTFNIQLNNLGLFYLEYGHYSKADSLLKIALDNYAVTLGENHTEYATVTGNIARLYAETGKFKEAEEFYLKAIKIRAKSGQQTSISYGTLLYNLAALYDKIGQYDKAKVLLLEDLKITKNILGEEHVLYADPLVTLAAVYQKTGKIAEAEDLYLKALRIGQRHSEVAPLDYSNTLNDVGLFYLEMGNYSKAEELLIESLKIKTQIRGWNDVSFSVSLDNLGLVYFKQRNFEMAEYYFQRCIDLFKKNPDGITADYAIYLNNLALLYMTTSRYAEAEKIYLEARDIFLEYFGRSHANFAGNLNNLGILYHMTGRFEMAEEMLAESLEIYKSLFGEYHPEYIKILNNLGQVYQELNEPEKAEKCYLECIEKKTRQILDVFPIMSESEKEKYVADNNPFFMNFQVFCLDRYGDNPLILNNWYNIQLIKKGMLFNASNKMRERILSSHDDQLIRLFNDWKFKKDYMSYVIRMSFENREQAGIDVTRLEEEINAIEKELSRRSEVFTEVTADTVNSWKHVRSILKSDEAAVEIVRTIKIEENDNQTVYAALIITAETREHPELVIFNQADSMEGQYLQYYQNAIRFRTVDENSYRVFWEPLSSKLDGIRRVYLSADGVYNQISMNTLWDPYKNEYLIDQIDLVIVGNTKDLLTRKPQEFASADIHDVALFGFANFDFVGRTDDADYQKNENPFFTVENIKQDSVSLRFFDGDKINMLPGTLEEVTEISKRLESSGISVKEYVYDQATESNIKMLISPDILHIATHGFFLSDIKFSNLNDTRYVGIETQQIKENPLLRSGLLFAGAANAFNESINQNISSEDGILTAYEAMNLNLDETQLVVLSACETGLGVTSNGEGVYGLQRAFQIAGATSVMMSLWTVSDEATQKMMVYFYDQWLNGKPLKQAFLKAQLLLREEYPFPFYWGAFVLIGE